MKKFVENYLLRHQNGVNRFLHIIGVPMTFVASVVFLAREEWAWAAACFVGGYVLQFLGHAVEGNDAGEVILVKRWLGLPYTEFGPASPLRPQSSGESPARETTSTST